MRLRDRDVAGIKAAAVEAFGPEAIVRLFGSRVDDRRRGGDIDLYVQVDPDTADEPRRRLFRLRLLRELGERAIDVVYAEPGAGRAIDKAALEEGIVL